MNPNSNIMPTKTSKSTQEHLLDVRNLTTHFNTEEGVVHAVENVSYTLDEGETLGVVGESGCGKSVTALSIMRMVTKPGRIVKGEIIYYRKQRDTNGNAGIIEEVNLTNLDGMGRAMRNIRGAEMSMIFQEPMTSLNPSYTVGDQIAEGILLHQGVDKAEAEKRGIAMLESVGMPNPALVFKRFPHELSGGMRQRAMISLALSCHPSILFADEPTTALDVTTEAQILDVMRELQAEFGMTIVFITHNLGVVAQMCDYVTVMYLGRVVEQATVEDTFYEPKHPYTSSLLRSIPHVGSHIKDRLQPIRGVVPDPYSSINGCPYHPRCDQAMQGKCDVYVPGLTQVGKSHVVRCFLFSDNVEEESHVE